MKKIADISRYQGNVDWDKAREELDFVIFRASVGTNADTKYLEYTAACRLPYGAYHYVKAGTKEEAEAEARLFVDYANKAAEQPAFYIADIEYEAQTATTTEAVCVAFLQTLRALGCGKIGLYINTRYKWAGAAIGMCDIVWIPHWGKNDGSIPTDQYKPKYPCDIWQYTSKGTLAGVKGNVDLDTLMGSKPLDYFTAGKIPEKTEETEEGSETKMLNNIQFAKFCLDVFAAKWVYWYGTYGNKCTQSKYEGKAKQYPAHYTSARKAAYMKDIANGCTCADCVGMIKAFFWTGGNANGTPKYASNGCPDKGANSMYALCKENGPIATIPDIPGLVVWKSGHIGVYVGDGMTVELKGFAYDCVKNKVTDGPWTNWGKLPASMLAYAADGGDASAPAEPEKLGDSVLKKGDKGNAVAQLQEKLVELGYGLGAYGTNKNGVDGSFGSKTEQAVKALQEKAGLTATGTFDTQAYKALLEALNPAPTPDETEPTEEDEPRDFVLIVNGDEMTLRKLHALYGGTLAKVDSVTVG